MPFDVPLLDAGIDSLLAQTFAESLSKNLSTTLNATLIFDYPSIGAIVASVLSSAPPTFFEIADSAIF